MNSNSQTPTFSDNSTLKGSKRLTEIEMDEKRARGLCI